MRQPGTGPRPEDVTETLGYAREFLEAMKTVEPAPKTSPLSRPPSSTSRRIRAVLSESVLRYIPASRNLPGLSDPAHPSNDAALRQQYLRALFGFIAAVRTTRNFMLGTARALGPEGPESLRRLDKPVVAFHVQLGNSSLHRRVTATARLFYLGGPKDQHWCHSYAPAEMESKAKALFEAIHRPTPGETQGVTALAEMVTAELTEIDAQTRLNGWY